MVAPRRGYEALDGYFDRYAPRPALDMWGQRPTPAIDAKMLWKVAVEAVDWNRVLIEAKGRHAAPVAARGFETAHSFGSMGEEICGECIKAVLLKVDE